jgi:hypothetical protein
MKSCFGNRATRIKHKQSCVDGWNSSQQHSANQRANTEHDRVDTPKSQQNDKKHKQSHIDERNSSHQHQRISEQTQQSSISDTPKSQQNEQNTNNPISE